MKRLERLLRMRRRRIVGLMSGTSADGVDAALLDVETLAPESERRSLTWELLDFVSVPYPPAVRAEILAVQEGAPRVLERLTRLHFLLAHLFADAVERVAADAGVQLVEIDAVASHGQTVCHFPHFEAALAEVGGRGGAASAPVHSSTAGDGAHGSPDRGHPTAGGWVSSSTLQIGEPAVLVERLGIPVVSNFRSRDVAAGGTGAPLVPLVDHLLFADPERSRLALNVGGIANFTALRAGAAREHVVAFDTGPGNMVVDAIMALITEGEKTMDAGGALARKGKPDRELVEEALQAPFFRQAPPRAAGRGEFGVEYARALREQCRKRRLTDASTLATATWLTARAVHDAYTRFILPGFAVSEVIVSGGGAHNVALMEYLAELFEDVKVVTSDYYGLDVDAKEAAAFALLAHLSLDGEAGNIPGVTGSAHPVILGTITAADVP